MNPLLLIGLGAAALWMLKDKSFNVGVGYGRLILKIARVSVNQGKLAMTFTMQNPSAQQITLGSMFGNVSVNGRKAGSISLTNPVVIPAGGEKEVETLVPVNLVNSLLNLADLASGKLPNSAITFTGTANIDGVAQPVKAQYRAI